MKFKKKTKEKIKNSIIFMIKGLIAIIFQTAIGLFLIDIIIKISEL